jgi:hypothetical protein
LCPYEKPFLTFEHARRAFGCSDRQITIVFTTEVSAVNHSRFLDTVKWIFQIPTRGDGVAMRLVLETPYLPLINLDIRATDREREREKDNER